MNPTSAHAAMMKLFEERSAKVAVVGLGYVGLPLAHAFVEGGFEVLGYDTDPSKVESLNKGEVYLPHLREAIGSGLQTSRFRPTSTFSDLEQADAIVICVPTPLGTHQDPDLQFVVGVGREIGRILRRGQLIVLESTSYPGTTRDDLLPAILETAAGRGDLVNGVDFFLAFSPERENPGQEGFGTRTIPKLVGGLDPTAGDLAAALYTAAIEQVVRVDSAEVAESAKLLENIFRAVNIALVNEMKMILSPMGVDIWEVVQAASTKPFGFMPFYPGPGLGGHCIPIDPFYFSWKAKEVGRSARFIELAGIVNHEVLDFVIDQLVFALNGVQKSVNGSRILVLGLAYKANVSDTRESPAFVLIERLRSLGAIVDYSDPHVPQAKRVRKHDLQSSSVSLTKETVAEADVVLIVTAHEDVDYALVAEHARLVVDTRDVMRPYRASMGARLVSA